ncbi:uncharacterized protein LOC112554611 [Pomacea canaliculata]|uniref:uncharacterized protein LOC112554611 n=1 Tax=Pomacea canaliculata TaxID=400727 RepID=UPI000D72D72F|nr:uncharacterized protein LOC112554611 [Pomacea canaliculata]
MGFRGRCIICFVVMLVFGGVQLHFIMSQPRHPPDHFLPCPPGPGVHWVRDPENCASYFICVSAQPVRMPACPKKTVWSVSAKNCVPLHSPWNDCPLAELLPTYPAPKLLPQPTPYMEKIVSIRTTAAERMGALVDHQHDPLNEYRSKIKRVYPNHPCVFGGTGLFLPHPFKCHWFYNCSAPLEDGKAEEQGWDQLTEECPYPKLFSASTGSCEDYSKVDCGDRDLYLDPCEYRALQCGGAHCQPCRLRHGSCVGMRDGPQPFPSREWTPRYLYCKDQRALQQLECPQETPIFSPESRRCETLLDIPREHGGYQPTCLGRRDGRYPDDTGRCDVFYECFAEKNRGRFHCPRGSIFDPEKKACRLKTERHLAPPCGNVTEEQVSLRVSVSLCRDLQDGLYADPYGRCSMFYECQHGLLKQYHRCSYGSFDPSVQECSFLMSHLTSPCGQQPNPCLFRSDGEYADQSQFCQASYLCRGHVVIRQNTCPPGTVFHEGKGSCQLPNDTPPPCGLAPSCTGRADGRYPAPLKGCQFFVTCRAGMFRGHEGCSLEEGGFYFNAETQMCDFPHNICPPCGVSTTNCTSRTMP